MSTDIKALRFAAPHNRARIERQVVDNDKAAFWAVKVFLKIGPKHPDYEEAVAEARMILFRAASRWNHVGEAAFSTYLTKSLLHGLTYWATKEWKYGFQGFSGIKERIERPLSLDLSRVEFRNDFMEPSVEGTAELNAENAEQEEVIRSMVAKLPQRIAEVITLRFFSNMTYEKIGERLDLSKERIRQLVARGLILIRNSEFPPPPRPKGASIRRCAHCHCVIPSIGVRKYCRPGYGCKIGQPADHRLVTGKAGDKPEFDGKSVREGESILTAV